jgi:DNA-directed RNA polymerase subunit RPC12/RpoP
MGLDPLICIECELYACDSNDTGSYRCPRCGSGVLEYMWMFDESQQKRINANTNFYRFVAGEDVT